VEDLRAFSGGNDESFGPDVSRDWFGDIDIASERRRMEEFAPVNRAADIKAPLLNAYGQNDPRVEILQWRLLERALRSAGRPVDGVVYPNEGHGWRNEENRLDWFRRMEAFLRQHNPSDVLK
jgi:dipeptidyl aminopeptidase/acylaminoacyl peptidase